MKSVITLFFIIIFSMQIFAGGFQINEHGAKALGMANAYTAVANDASAIYWNGAGLNQLDGTQIMLGTTLISPMSEFTGVAGTPTASKYEMESSVFFSVHFFAAHKFNDKFSAGLGFTTPFGLGTEWSEDWIGRYLAVETQLTTFTISPVAAYEVVDNLSLSAGFVYSFANVLISRKIPTPLGDASIKLDGDDQSAFGYNLGLMYKPTKCLSLGISFHSQVKYEFEGTAEAEAAIPVLPLIPKGDVTAGLTTPFNLAFGAAYRFSPKFLLSFDFQYVGWSSYDSLIINFENTAYSDIASPREYENSFIARLGTEYSINDCFSLLGGFYFDKMPVEPQYLNPTLPDADRFGFTLGFAYNLLNNLELSASYLYIHGSEVTVTDSREDFIPNPLDPAVQPFNGTYSSIAHLASLSLLYSL